MIIWILTDDRAGNNTQTIGVAEALELPFIEKKLIYNKWARLPNFIKGASLIGVKNKDVFLENEFPDILISAGRKQATIARCIKEVTFKTKLIHLMNPDCPFDDFDLVVLPEHDKYNNKENANNVLYTIGSPNSINKQKLDKTVENTTAVLIGGDNKHGKFTKKNAEQFINKIKGQGSLIVTVSRRTPSFIKEMLIKNNIEISEMPYLEILSKAEKIIVTGDSIAMCAESCGTGKPVYIFAPSNASKKHMHFINSLYKKGYARELGDKLESWDYEPLNEAKRVAKAINIIREIK